MSLSMIAPNGANSSGAIVQCGRTGNSYTADNNGFIYGVNYMDVEDLAKQGWELVPSSAAVWQFGGAQPPNPGWYFHGEGNIYRNVGNPIGQNAADTTDDILGGFQLPAGAFDQLGRMITITAQGATGNTTNNKRFKCFVNATMTGQTVNADGSISGGHVTAGTPVGDSGAWVNGSTANQAAGWQLIVDIAKYGAPGSNTQYSQGSPILGTLHGGVSPPAFLTLSESAAINIVITGSSYTTGAAGDIILQYLQLNTCD